jgi:RNase H-fold protein (predicted Holliday junction resolvase)
MVTLGLDASTNCVGYAFTQDKKILDMGFIDIKKEKTPKEKVHKVLGFLNESSYIDMTTMTARKNVFGKARIKGIKAKELVKMKIEEMYDTSNWCKKTTRGNWDKRNIDMYDGLVMSLFEKKD